MMFEQISRRIALQFTAFVFLLFLINGLLFLAADLGNARRQSHFRLQRAAHGFLREGASAGLPLPLAVPPMLRERIRIVDASGTIIYGGGFFTTIPFAPETGIADLQVGGDEYRILTTPVIRDGSVVGYMQMADVQRLQFHDLPQRILLYLLVSILVSALTYVVGLFFARRSLQPARQAMERLEQFTQDASHELRTPLAALSSSLDLALKTKKYEEGMRSAKEDVREITTLVESLLELARLDTLTLGCENIALSSLVFQTVEKHRPLADREELTLETSIDDGVTVRTDPSLFRQLLSNLLSNAVKFTPAGGQIHVRLTPFGLQVKDTGIGMDDEALGRIFDRFFQAETSRCGDGYGLGLALVKRIADLHGWSIDVESEKGNGTTFTIGFER